MLYWAEAVTGFAIGGLYALVAVGITQIYKVTRVFNFAHSGFILWGAYLYSTFSYAWHIPVAFGCILSLLSVGAMGVATELLIFKFANRSSASSKIILTFGLLEFLTSAAFWIFGGNPMGSVPIFTGGSVGLLGTRVSWNQVGMVGAAVLIVVGFGVFLKYTRLGLLTRATAEDAAMAEVLGSRPTLIGCLNWGLASMVAGVAGVFIASAGPITLDLFYTFFITSLVAVVIGGLSSLPLTVLGGLALGVATNEILATQFTLGNLCIFAVMVAFVIFKRSWPPDLQPARTVRGKAVRDESSSWTLTALFTAVFVVGWIALGVSAISNNVWGVDLCLALVYCLACLSLVPIIRYTGQVSLAQAGLMGIGAYAMDSFDLHDHIPLVFSVLLAALLAGAFGAAIGFIVRKISFVLAAVMTLEFLNIAGLFQGGKYAPWVARLGFAGIEFQTPDYINTWDRLAIAFVIVAVVIVIGLRNVAKSSLGDRLLAAKTSPRMALHFGIGPSRTRIYAYALSGVIAGVAGSAYVLFLTDASGGTFSNNLSLYILIYAVVGGASTIWGPFVGALIFIGFPQWIGLNRFGASPFPLMAQGVLLVLLTATSVDGLAGLFRHPSSTLPTWAPARALVARFIPSVREAAAANESIGEVLSAELGTP